MYHTKMTFRALKRNGRYTVINIAGLAVGMAFVGFVAMWIYGALTFDAYHSKAKDTYLITYTVKRDSGVENCLDDTSLGITSVMEQIPDIRHYASILFSEQFSLAQVDEQVYILNSALVNPDWFTVFDYNLLYGTLKEFGVDPFCAVLTSSEAQRLYGTEKAVGEILTIGEQAFTVQAVVKDPPINSSFTYGVLFPIEANRISQDWALYKDDTNYYSASFFVLLSKTADREHLIRSIEQFLKESERREVTVHLLALKKMHFDSHVSHPTFARGDPKPVRLLSLLAGLLLVVACLNYINLTTARTHVRAKEIDIKKILGAKPIRLFGQIMNDALWTNLLALLCALLIVIILTPYLESIFQLSRSYLQSPWLWLVFALVMGVTTLLSGIYPAMMLSSIKPLTSIQGRTVLGVKSKTIRYVLVIFQFIVSAGLIMGMLTLSRQMAYIRNSNPGYDRKEVAAIPFFSESFFKLSNQQKVSTLKSIKEELQAYPSFQSVSLSSAGAIVKVTHGINTGADWDGYDDSDHRYKDFKIKISHMSVDADYLQTLGLQMVQGRWFDPDNTADSRNVVVNETAIRELNIAAPYIGQRFAVWGRQGQIIGIVKDFHFNSLHQKIGPIVLSNAEIGNYLVFKAHSGKMDEAVEKVKQVLARFFADAPFEVIYTEEVFNNLYKDDTKLARMVSMLGLLSILIACLGLFGLVTFSAETRTKEVGIRKVLGARIIQIVIMLSKEFLLLVGIAMLIAFPLAWYLLNRMLQDFAYRITIGWWIFALAGIITVILTLLTVGWQAVKAATANPVKAISTSE